MKDIINRINTHTFDVGPIRPPSEGGSYSLLIRFTCNCPWNMCTFCWGSPYGRNKFKYREVEEIKRDIDHIKVIADSLYEISWLMGYGGELHPNIISFIASKVTSIQFEKILIVWHWLRAGEKSVFIQDADSLIMRTHHIVEAITYLKRKFPKIKRITSYARSKSIYKKSLTELKEIHAAGLIRLHIGLESGDDEVLQEIKKGASAKEHIISGQRAKEAGFEVSEYIMPGVGGKDKTFQHAIHTADVINEINPEFVRSRPFVPRPGTPLYLSWQKGKFRLLSPHELLMEIRLLVERLKFSGRLCFDHMRNPAYYVDGSGYNYLFSQTYDGYKFLDEKEKVLKIIERGLFIPEEHFLKIEDIIEYEKNIYRI